MKILLIGHRGQLGTDLAAAFASEELTLSTQDELSVVDADKVLGKVAELSPDVILNCAAFHRVDECETVPERAFEVNVFGVRNLAIAARETGAVLVHFSTDYVFQDGSAPHREDELPSPRSQYGVSKLAGEAMLASLWHKHFIIRTSGLYGYKGSREKGTNFVETMLNLGKQGKPVRVVNDQVLTPTNTRDLADAVRQLVPTGAYGLYHLTNAGQCSWFEFTKAIFEEAGLTPDLTPVTSDAFPAAARRPSYSVLDNHRFRELGFEDMPHWRDAIKRYVAGRAAAGRT